MIEAIPDPPSPPYRPDPDRLAEAHNRLMHWERDGHRQHLRHVRQRWEEALGASRVALAAVRDLYPMELEVLSDKGGSRIARAHRSLQEAVIELDLMSRELLGDEMVDVLVGRFEGDDE